MSQGQSGFVGRIDQSWRRVAFAAIAALAVVLVFGDASPRAAGNFTPTIKFETSTSRAAAHPDARITIDNSSSSEDIEDLTIDLPDSFMGSLNAAEQCSVVDAQNFDCGTSSIVGSVTNYATVDNSDVKLSGTIYLTEALNATDPAGLQIVVPAVIGGVDMGEVRVNARVEIRYAEATPDWVQNGAPSGAVGSIKGIRTIVNDVPREITDSNDRTVEFSLKKLVVDLRSNQTSGFSKLLTNPSRCGAYEISANAVSYDATSESMSDEYVVDQCDTVRVGDFDLDFTPDATTAATDIAFTTSMTFPDGQPSAQRLRLQMPPSIQTNTSAFGDANLDQCPLSSFDAYSEEGANVFNPGDCPDQAKVGSVEIVTPLLPEPLVGELYFISGTLPELGIYVDESTGPNNPAGVKFGVRGFTAADGKLNPNCPGGISVPGGCKAGFYVDFEGLPDIPLKQVTVTVDGATRESHEQQPLTGKFLRFAAGGATNCEPNMDFSAKFISHVDENAERPSAGLASASITGCNARTATLTASPFGEFTNPNPPSFTYSSAATTAFCSVNTQVTNQMTPCDPVAGTGTFTPGAALTPGVHYFYSRTTSPSQQYNHRAFAIPVEPTPDSTAPTASIDSGPSGTTADSTPEWTFSSTEDSFFQCSVDGGAFLPCESGAALAATGSYEITDALFAGTQHTFAVRAQDEYGNVSAADEVTIDVEIDFAPSLTTNLTTTQARAHPDLDVTINSTSQEDLKAVKLSLPSGFFGGLTGVQGLCPVATAAAGNCTAASQVGTVETEARVDESLVRIDGQVYLTESAHVGEPAGLSIKVPAVIQDVDLGDIIVAGRLQVRGQAEGIDSLVVEIPKEIDPATSGNTYDSLTEFDMREITLKLRTGAGATHPLLTNPSSCNGSAFVASFTGYASTLASDSNPFAATGCEALGFSPNLAISLTDSTTGGPPGVGEFVSSKVYTNLSATLTANPGESGLKDASILMPKPVTIDPQQIPTPCSVAEYAGGAGQCPAYATIGNASAISPLLPEPLTGTVYLLKNADPRQALPGLLIALRGRINIDIIAYNRFENGSQIRTMLSSLPDVPLSSFTLNVNRLITTRPEACTVPADEWGVTGNLTAFNGKPAPVTQQLAFNCSPKYTFSYRKKAKKTTFGVTATGGPVRIKNLEVKLPKSVTSITKVRKNKKLMKKRLIVKTDGKRLNTRCFKLYKTKLKVTLPCGKVKFASVISASFRAGLLDAGRRAPTSKKLKKLTISGRSTTNARIKFTK